ncbi:MAG: hypothetical protein J7J52_04200 [Deltaproteobacteria bacterium]|nr:hypothetical protein [Deltaproteobacteria bacterium]
MIYFTAWYWQILCHMVGLSVCCLTIIFIISSRVGEKHEAVRKSDQDHINSFDVEDLLKKVKEHSGTAFRSVYSITDKEQTEFKELLGGLETERHNALNYTEDLPDPDIRSGRGDSSPIIENNGTEDEAAEPYRQVLDLASKGLGVDRIARQMKMARGEIELILKLRRQFCKAYGNGKQRPAFLH